MRVQNNIVESCLYLSQLLIGRILYLKSRWVTCSLQLTSELVIRTGFVRESDEQIV